MASKTYHMSYNELHMCDDSCAANAPRSFWSVQRLVGAGVGVLFYRKVYLFLRDAKLLLRDSIYKFQKINTSIWGIPYKQFWRFAPLHSYYRKISPRRGRGGTAIYGLYRYVPLWRVSFSSSWLWDMVYKSESLGLEWGIIFQEIDQLVEDFSLD